MKDDVHPSSILVIRIKYTRIQRSGKGTESSRGHNLRSKRDGSSPNKLLSQSLKVNKRWRLPSKMRVHHVTSIVLHSFHERDVKLISVAFKAFLSTRLAENLHLVIIRTPHKIVQKDITHEYKHNKSKLRNNKIIKTPAKLDADRIRQAVVLRRLNGAH